jgi:lactoylglutathione lyase
MTSDTNSFRTGHVGLNVTELERSVTFYQAIFGFEVAARSEPGAPAWAFLSHEGELVLTLWQQSTGEYPTERPGLHHLSFEVETIDQLRAVESRIHEAGAVLRHGGLVPHAEGADSGGLYFTDPDGIRLEVFVAAGVTAASDAGAPTPGAPTCGFF